MTRFTEAEQSAIRNAARLSGISFLDREALVMEARRQQGEAVARMAKTAGRWIAEATGLASLSHAVARTVRSRLARRRTLAALETLDERMLADIGLNRGSIEAVANELAGLPAPQPLWQRALEAFLRSRQRSSTVRQLRALPDNVLRDLGLERGNIETAVDEALSGGGYRAKPAAAQTGDFFDQVAASIGLLPLGRRSVATASLVADADTATRTAIAASASASLPRAANRNESVTEVRAAG